MTGKEVLSAHATLNGQKWGSSWNSNLFTVEVKTAFMVLFPSITNLQERELYGMYIWKIDVLFQESDSTRAERKTSFVFWSRE